MDIALKRIYEPAEKGDGFWVLVDRLWPRGVAKEAAGVDLWAKGVAPSSELRKWFHGGGGWEEFRTRYTEELSLGGAAVNELMAEWEGSGEERLTLLYASREEERNHALVLRDFLVTR